MSTAAPIGDHGLIGDTRTAGLVDPDGSIVWMCVPRFDSPPIFGRMVGGEGAGWFGLRPDEPATPAGRRYVGDTATLETAWDVEGGRLVLSDAMVAEVAGRLLPATLLVRRVTSHGRRIPVRVELVARFGYARQPARRVRRQAGWLVLEHRDVALAASTDAPDGEMVVDRPTRIVVEPGRPLTVVMTAAHRGSLMLVPAEVAVAEADRDRDRWQEWAGTLVTGAGHRRALLRSFVTLRLLTYSPSGAPVAAPTTSLPEVAGGDRNWDYRYAWPRDAATGIAAFLAAGNDQEALGFLAWLLHAGRLARPRLPALFTLDGRPAPRERELEGWPGHAGSRPVRIGNGAGTQHQLDGYGWVLDAAWQVARRGHRLDGETWRTMSAFADYVERHWMLPDAGIWERRDAERHHVHSKLMGWVALDRAIRIGDLRPRPARHQARWIAARRALADDVRTRGFDTGMGSYTAAYGSGDVDAALLLLPATGFEAPGSPRLAGTIAAIRERLGAGGPLVYRYRGPDGLTGQEGAFLPCSFWLVQALASIGRRTEAEALFEDLLAVGGQLGLYAEEVDPVDRSQLGNFPQALTHSALLQAALAIQGTWAGTAGPAAEVPAGEAPPR